MGDPGFFRQQYLNSPLPTYIWRRVGSDFVYEEANRAGDELGGNLTPSFAGRLASDIYRSRPEILAAMHEAWAGNPVRLDVHYTLAATGREEFLRLDIAPLPPEHLAIYLQN